MSEWRKLGHRPETARGRGLVAVAGLLASAVAVFVVLAPPERCPQPSTAALRSSAAAAVDWFSRNQRADGTWLYLYDAPEARDKGGYDIVRHAGAVMGLYQAAAHGIDGALETADAGVPWALEHTIDGPDWQALSLDGQTPAGATALFVAGLAERRAATGSDEYDDLLQRLGRFLVVQIEPSGAVMASYDLRSGAPTPGVYSRYYTGETYWALARLHLLFPGQPWSDAAARVSEYVATQRDAIEDYWPPLPDHWAAYGLADIVAAGDRPLTAGEIGYARRQAQLFGAQVRWVAQRSGAWGTAVRGTYELRGGGYGVVGEALTGLWRVAEADPRLADLRAPLAARAECIAGLAIAAQETGAEASTFAEPDRVAGAWFRDGETRMDDQQHALAALLRTEAIIDAGPPRAGDPEGEIPPATLWLAALLAAYNPFRAALAVPRAGRTRGTVAGTAAVGGLLASLLATGGAAVSGPVLDAFDVSVPSMRLAAGVVGAIGGVVALVRRPPPAEPAWPGWGAAVIPVAVPVVLSPALFVLALGGGADRGAWLVLGSGLLGTALLAALSTAVAKDATADRILAWAGRLTAAVLVLTSTFLVVSGVLDV
jgi:hypothetical protein